MYYREVAEISNRSWKNEFFTFKPPGKLFYTPPNFDAFFRYQYLFNYNNFLNMTYPNTSVFLRARYWYPF